MTKLTKLVAALILAGSVSLQAQTITGFGSGDFLINDANSSFDSGTSPVQTSTNITFSGVDGGTSFYVVLNTPAFVGYGWFPELTVTLNVANTNGFGIEVFDTEGESVSFDGNWSSFTTGVSSTVTLGYAGGGQTFNGTAAAVLLSTGGTGQTLNVTFDQLSVPGAAIPEPSTYAALSGIAVLGFVAYRRRRSAA